MRDIDRKFIDLIQKKASKEELVQALNEGADPNCSEPESRKTPLLYAISKSHLEAVTLLISRRVKVIDAFPAAIDKATSLLGQDLDWQIVAVLIKAGAPVNQLGGDGKALIHQLASKDYITMFGNDIKRCEILGILLSHNNHQRINLKLRDSKSKTALMIAQSSGYANTAAAIINAIELQRKRPYITSEFTSSQAPGAPEQPDRNRIVSKL